MRKKVACTRSGMPASVATFQDQRTLSGSGTGLGHLERSVERDLDLLTGAENDLIALRRDRDAGAHRRADRGALGHVTGSMSQHAPEDAPRDRATADLERALLGVPLALQAKRFRGDRMARPVRQLDVVEAERQLGAACDAPR